MVWWVKIFRLLFISAFSLYLVGNSSAETYENMRNVERAKAELAYLSTAAEFYLNNHKWLVGSIENIVNEMHEAGCLDSEQLLFRKNGVVDPWGNYYVAKVIKGQLYIISSGPSGEKSGNIKWKVNAKLPDL